MTGLSREPDALEVVYRSSWLALTRLAYLLVGDRSEAEDIVQTVFVSAAARWHAIEEPSTYLRQAVVNRAHDVHRRAFRNAGAAVAPTNTIGEPDVDEAWKFVQALPTIEDALFPAPLPDGETVAYVSGVPSAWGSPGQGISIASVDEPGSARTLIDGAEAIAGLTASPDGTKLAYGRMEGTRFNGGPLGGIYVVDVATGAEENVMHGPGIAEWLDDDTLIVSD